MRAVLWWEKLHSSDGMVQRLPYEGSCLLTRVASPGYFYTRGQSRSKLANVSIGPDVGINQQSFTEVCEAVLIYTSRGSGSTMLRNMLTG